MPEPLSLINLINSVVLCTTILPLNPGVVESPYIHSQQAVLSHGFVYRRWDLDLDKHPDVMTVHQIDVTQLEYYKHLHKQGTPFDITFETRPIFYWVDMTGSDSWDRIYMDLHVTGKCQLYATKEEDA